MPGVVASNGLGGADAATAPCTDWFANGTRTSNNTARNRNTNVERIRRKDEVGIKTPGKIKIK
jgi:hypothetical protein